MKRRCIDCDTWFEIVYDTDWLCDVCSERLVESHLRLTHKEMLPRKWEDKRIKEQWLESYKTSSEKLLSKCKGTNYYN